ncbi:hypothetical protein HDV00_005584 [Rhizophlyctis rosea]|nr:hypothetical protein HDV00_005584 [Rhizophlyctis rosea]
MGDAPIHRLPTFTPPQQVGRPLGLVGTPPTSPPTSPPLSPNTPYGRPNPYAPQQHQYSPGAYQQQQPIQSFGPTHQYSPQPYAQNQYANTAASTDYSSAPKGPQRPQHQDYAMSAFNSQAGGSSRPYATPPERESLEERKDTKQLLEGRTSANDTPAGHREHQPGTSAPKAMRWWPSGRWSQVAMSFVVFELILLVVTESYFIYRENNWFNNFPSLVDDEKEKSMFVYQATFLAAQFFLLLVAWDAVIQKNILQIFALDLYSVGCAGYSLIQYVNLEGLHLPRTDQPLQILQWVVIGIEILSTVILFGLSYALFKEFGWQVYRIYGASVELRKHLRNYHVLLLLLKFTLFFYTVFVVILIALVSRSSAGAQQALGSELALGAVGIPLGAITIALGYFGLIRESKRLLWAFNFWCLAGLGFVLYRLIRMRQSQFKSEYEYSTTYLTFFGIILEIHLILCLLFSYMTSSRFGRGLQESLKKGREHIYDEEEPAAIEARKRQDLDLDL